MLLCLYIFALSIFYFIDRELLEEYGNVISQVKNVDVIAKENDEIDDAYKSIKPLVLSYASERGEMSAGMC